VRKEQVGGETVREKMTQAEVEAEAGLMHGPLLTPLAEGPSIVVDIEEFEYTYRCTHCGHQWSEKHEEEHVAKP
jgi:hypothetical protein